MIHYPNKSGAQKIKHCGIISSSRAVHADGTKVHHVFIDLWDVVKLITKIRYLGSPVLRENVSRAANIFQHVNGLIIYYPWYRHIMGLFSLVLINCNECNECNLCNPITVCK